MTTAKARNILHKLANGINPYTGKDLSEKSIIRKPQTVQALRIATERLSGFQQFDITRSKSSQNRGTPWTKDEEKRMVSAFKKGTSIDVIAKVHGRTNRAIEMRLEKLGRI